MIDERSFPMATKTVSKNYDSYEGTNGKDIITITAKKSARIYGMGGNDKITVTRGTDHWVYGYDGNDTIIVKKGSGFYVISGNNGKDKITVQDGAKPGVSYHYSGIAGCAGNDIITVTNKKGRYYRIEGDEGKDIITVKYGRDYEINGGSGNDTIKITGVKNFAVNQSSFGSFDKDTITVTGGSNGLIFVTDKSKVTINSGTGHTVEGSDIGTINSSTIIINGGKKLTVRDSDWGATNEAVTVRGGSGTMKLEKGTDTISFDFKDKTKIGKWDISVSKLKKNRLTVLNAASKDFTWKRDVDRWGLGNAYVKPGSDCWILTHSKTKKSIILSGWGENDTKTFDIYFAKDNKLVSSVPNKTDWKKLGL
jgi:hypothetical protein